jgi:predicted alpha/beta hydrolase
MNPTMQSSAQLAGATRGESSTAAQAEDLRVSARDGYPLSARLWRRPDTTSPSFVALINAGAGIAQGYYERFAAYLADASVPTITYDYRGIGRSRPASLNGFAASVEDWGRLDCAAVIEWLATRYPAASQLVVGHSVGGFVTGFVTNGARIDRMLFIGAHTGYWGDYRAGARPWMYLLWHAFMPAVTRAIGYFPGRRLHLLEDLPAGVAFEWANRRKPDFWWNLRTAGGAPDTSRIDEVVGRFLAIRARVLALRFTDDPFGTDAATQRVVGLYGNSHATVQELGPADAGDAPIGHFGFFRARFRATLWPRVTAWLAAEELAARATSQVPITGPRAV